MLIKTNVFNNNFVKLITLWKWKSCARNVVFSKRWHNLPGCLSWIWHVSNFQILAAVILQDYKEPIFVIPSKHVNVDSTTAPVLADACLTCCQMHLLLHVLASAACLRLERAEPAQMQKHTWSFSSVLTNVESAQKSPAEGGARLDGLVILQDPGSLSPPPPPTPTSLARTSFQQAEQGTLVKYAHL